MKGLIARLHRVGALRLTVAVSLSLLSIASSAAGPFSLAEWQARVSQTDDVDALGQLYVELLLETDPPLGMLLGIHGRNDEPSRYDDHLPETSGEGWAIRKLGHAIMRARLELMDPAVMTVADQVDFRMLEHRVSLRMLEMSALHGHWDPATYVVGRENVLTGLSDAFALLLFQEHAPRERRLRSFGSRCRSLPKYLAGATRMLGAREVRPTPVAKRTALAGLERLTADDGLFYRSLPAMLDNSALPPDERADIQRDCYLAVDALEHFADWLRSDLVNRASGEWRLGRRLYGRKYDLYMDFPLSPGELLAAAESDLARVGDELIALSRQIHDDYLGGDVEPAAGLTDRRVVDRVFVAIGEDRATPDTVLADTRGVAAMVAEFVRRHDLLDLSPADKLRIEVTPAELSGYAPKQLLASPPFGDDRPSTLYWDTAMLAGDRGSDDFLASYNRPYLALSYIRDCVPGLLLRRLYSRRGERVIPKAFPNPTMEAGWAGYMGTQLVDGGFTVYPEDTHGRQVQRLVETRRTLHATIDAIVDIRLHTGDWPEAEAIRLLTERGYRSAEEAEVRLDRARLAPLSLVTDYAGYLAIRELEKVELAHHAGNGFRLRDFNERLLQAGARPSFAVTEQVLGRYDATVGDESERGSHDQGDSAQVPCVPPGRTCKESP